MDTDRNLLFGVLALQADLIDPECFARACTLWSAQKATPLADLMMQHGWLTPEDRADVERLLERKLKKHGGDARAGLAEATTDRAKQSLAAVPDPDLRQSLAGLTTPPAPGPVQLSTTAYVPEVRQRYTLTRLHATGGIGRVWLAHDASLGRDVALKELRPERAGNPAVGTRFLREAQITGQLEHPGVVPIYEVGQRPEDQAPFYTMRFVRGRTLAEAVAAYHQRRARGEAGPLELRELLTAFVGVCNAVAFAHSRGVLHRDLKPQNVVLGDYGEVIVLDWGLARLLHQAPGEGDAVPVQVSAESEAGATVQGQVLGTPAYMAPEQAEGRLDQLGPATDVYGLGAVLYEILAGRAPFRGKETAPVLRQVIYEPPARPRSMVGAAPAALEAVCLKALAKKPAERYATAKEVAAEVQRWLADEPVSAYRPPLAARAGRWLRRHRTLAAAAAAAALVALVGLGAALGLQARANAELRAANDRERARFELALEAIKTYHTGVSEDVLLKEEQFQGLRRRLLKGAADFYAKLEQLLAGQPDTRSQRDLAEAYFQLGELMGKVGSNDDGLAAHRKGLELRRALAARGEPGAGLDVARSLMAVGDRQFDAGDVGKAVASYQEARQWAEAAGASEEALALVADSHLSVGEAHFHQGEFREALEEANKGLPIRQRLADSNSGLPALQRGVADGHLLLGLALGRLNRDEEALRAHQKAAELYRKVADVNPADPAIQDNLAKAHNNVGVELWALGRTKQAVAEYRQAVQILQKASAANPAVTVYRNNVAFFRNNLGSALAETGQRGAALREHRAAIQIMRKLADDYRTVPTFRRNLAKGHQRAGVVLTQMGQATQALPHLAEAVTLWGELADAPTALPSYRSSHAAAVRSQGVAFQKAGRPAEAAAAFQKALTLLKKKARPMPDDLYATACAHSLLSGVAPEKGSGLTTADADAEATEAMAALRRAIRAGYHDLAHLRKDPELDSLRRRKDFQKLLKELETKGKTKDP
jgi:serine/threonine-protein kinase